MLAWLVSVDGTIREAASRRNLGQGVGPASENASQFPARPKPFRSQKTSSLALNPSHHRAFPPGFAKYVESDITHSKQRTEEFLPGARTAPQPASQRAFTTPAPSLLPL